MRSARPRISSMSEYERLAEYAESQPYLPTAPKLPLSTYGKFFWTGFGILACCAVVAVVYVGAFQWR